MNYNEVEDILDVYTLEDILELNDKTEVDVLYFLLEEEFLELPTPLPVDILNEVE